MQLFDTWLDYVYGGMYEYVNNMDSPRAVKYGLSANMKFPDLTERDGVYNVYTAEEDAYYEFCINAYLSKYDRVEDYYEKIKFFKTNNDKLIAYIKEDSKLSEEEKKLNDDELKLLKDNYISFKKGEGLLNKDIVSIQELIKQDTTTFSYNEYTVELSGDKKILTINAEIIDDMDCAYHYHKDEYVLDFSDCCIEVFGTVYIDQEAFAEKMREFSAYRYDNNWISKETLSDWEATIDEKAVVIAESMGIDYSKIIDLDKDSEELSDAEKQLIRECVINIDCMDKMGKTFYASRKTSLDKVNDEWDEAMFAAGIAASLMFLVTPAAPAEIASFTVGVVSGTHKLWMGDTEGGVVDIGLSVVGSTAAIVKEVGEARHISNLMNVADDLNDVKGINTSLLDYDFAIDEQKLEEFAVALRKNKMNLNKQKLLDLGNEYGISPDVMEKYISDLENDGIWECKAYKDAERKLKNQYGIIWDKFPIEDQQYLTLGAMNSRSDFYYQISQSEERGISVFEEYLKRYNNTAHTSGKYKFTDIWAAKVTKHVEPKTYTGIPKKYADMLPQADAFVTDEDVLEYTKRLLFDCEEVQKCNDLETLGKVLYEEQPSVKLVSFQSVDSPYNVVNQLNFGRIADIRESGPFQVPANALNEYVENYPSLCKFENGKFTITDFERFGKGPLSGVPLNSSGAYIINTKVPFNGNNIAMPSVCNGSSYSGYFVSGGRLLSGGTETTIRPLKGALDGDILVDGKLPLNGSGVRNCDDIEFEVNWLLPEE